MEFVVDLVVIVDSLWFSSSWFRLMTLHHRVRAPLRSFRYSKPESRNSKRTYKHKSKLKASVNEHYNEHLRLRERNDHRRLFVWLLLIANKTTLDELQEELSRKTLTLEEKDLKIQNLTEVMSQLQSNSSQSNDLEKENAFLKENLAEIQNNHKGEYPQSLLLNATIYP